MLAELLCKPEINQFDVPRLVNHHVFWFQVSVDDMHSVERLKSSHYLAAVVMDPVTALGAALSKI